MSRASRLGNAGSWADRSGKFASYQSKADIAALRRQRSVRQQSDRAYSSAKTRRLVGVGSAKMLNRSRSHVGTIERPTSLNSTVDQRSPGPPSIENVRATRSWRSMAWTVRLLIGLSLSAMLLAFADVSVAIGFALGFVVDLLLPNSTD